MSFFFYDHEKFLADYHVIIGPNGSGKSTFLRNSALEFIKDNKNVIAICPSMYDKFQNIKGKMFSFTGGRLGKRLVQKNIIELLKKVSKDDLNLLKNVSQTLLYMGFRGEIGIKLKYLNDHALENLRSSINSEKKYLDIKQAVRRWSSEASVDEIVWLKVESFSINEISNSIISKLTFFENLLKKHNVISSIEYYLKKGNEPIPLFDASSGELTLLSSVIFICNHIDRNSVIIIDEPETSLHPLWQKEYLSKILDLFHYWQPKIIIATHSPIIVSGVESDHRNIKVKIHELGLNNELIIDSKSESIEETMWERFKILTPHSSYLTNQITALLNQLSEKKITLKQFKEELNLFKESSYDHKQINAIGGLIDLGEKVSTELSKKE